MNANARTQTTADEFGSMPSPPGVRQELVDGEIVTMPPPGSEHGDVAMALGARLRLHAESHKLGKVYAAETGFRLSIITVRAADVAFVRADRVPAGRVIGYLDGSPDLAVEVRSPSESLADVMDKLRDWLEYGAREAWLADPESASITVYASGSHPIRVYHRHHTIECGEWLGGLRIPLVEVFPEYDTTGEPEPPAAT